MKQYNFKTVQEGLGLSMACKELKDADPKILAAIGPNTLEQYGRKDKLSITINYTGTSDGSFMIDDFVITGRTMDKESAFNILNNMKLAAIPNREHEGEYNPPRQVNIVFRHTDNHDQDEEYGTTLYSGEITNEQH